MGLFEDAVNWLSDKADEARDGIKNVYQDVTSQAKDVLDGITPEPLKPAMGAIAGGAIEIGGKVLDFLDPVSYALDTAASTLDTIRLAPKETWEAMKMVASGDIEGGVKRWGASELDSLLTSAQLFTVLMPAGHVAGKAAKAPVKAARKELKTLRKELPKGAPERKEIQQSLKGTLPKQFRNEQVGRASGKVAEQEVQDQLSNARKRVNMGRGLTIKLPERDWSKLGLEKPKVPGALGNNGPVEKKPRGE